MKLQKSKTPVLFDRENTDLKIISFVSEEKNGLTIHELILVLKYKYDS